MVQSKVIISQDRAIFEKEINDFLKDLNTSKDMILEYVDIKYSTCVYEHTPVYLSCIILYQYRKAF